MKTVEQAAREITKRLTKAGEPMYAADLRKLLEVDRSTFVAAVTSLGKAIKRAGVKRATTYALGGARARAKK